MVIRGETNKQTNKQTSGRSKQLGSDLKIWWRKIRWKTYPTVSMKVLIPHDMHRLRRRGAWWFDLVFTNVGSRIQGDN
jgi:hypothetical protein